MAKSLFKRFIAACWGAPEGPEFPEDPNPIPPPPPPPPWEPPGRLAQFEVYEDQLGEFRWRLKAGNGQVMADSGEGYVRKDGCLDAILRFRELVSDASVEVEERQ